KHKKLVYDHGATDETAPLFRVTVLFSEVNGKTKMDMTMTLPTPEAAEQTRLFVKKVGGESTWDRLAEYLEKTVSGKEKFVINRSFDAPIALVFKMFTDRDHLKKWVPPTGFEMQYIDCQIKPGGKTFYKMGNGTNVTMYGRTEYLEIREPDLIVYRQQFCDENEKVSRHPLVPTWPETMHTTVQLTEEGPERTRVTITWECVGEVTAEELQTFINGRSGMTQGWTGSLDKLEDYLSDLQK
ncbi:MAG TPA: SRPBCC family protein, partial [Chroococcales cyanobacterium]